MNDIANENEVAEMTNEEKWYYTGAIVGMVTARLLMHGARPKYSKIKFDQLLNEINVHECVPTHQPEGCEIYEIKRCLHKVLYRARAQAMLEAVPTSDREVTTLKLNQGAVAANAESTTEQPSETVTESDLGI